MRLFPSCCCCPLLVLLLCCSSATSSNGSSSECSDEEWNDHPVLCGMVDRVENDLEALAEEISRWAESKGFLEDYRDDDEDDDDDHRASNEVVATTMRRRMDDGDAAVVAKQQQLPVVLAHGMGGSCWRPGFRRLVNATSEILGGVYTVCFPIGNNEMEDIANGFFMNMDDSIDVFARKIREDSRLANGFHAIGFSQGTALIRGYVARYNNPTVNTFVSVDGVCAGCGSVSYCQPPHHHHTKPPEEETTTIAASEDRYDYSHHLPGFCYYIVETGGKFCYTRFAQKHSFQCNYFRDPRPSQWEAYRTHAQLARFNNEGHAFHQEYKDNWAKTSKFVWVLAEQDSSVWPREGEQWGCPDPKDPFDHMLPMNETDWYKKDLFGLKTAQEAGKNHFESFPGDHMQFTAKDFKRWVETYLTP